MMIRDY